MGGVADAVLGGGGSPSEVVDLTPKEFRRLRGPVSNSLKDIIQSGGGPTYQGPFTAPMSGNEASLISQLFGSTQNTGASQASGDYLSEILGGKYLSPGSNPHLAATIEAAQRPVLQAFQEVTQPNMRAMFTNAGQTVQGQGSSPFLETERRANRDLMTTLSDISTNIVGKNFEAERARQQEAAALAPTVQRQEVDQLIAGLQAQALPRMIEQLGVDRGLEEFRRQVSTLMQALGVGVQASSPTPATIQGTPGSEGMLGGLATGAGMALASMF